MSNQSEIDYDKQFQDDLAKATALSLEQQALDDYRRAKKYGTAAHYYSEQQRAHSHSPSLQQHSHTAQRQQSTESVVDYYAQLRARYQQSRGNSNDIAATTTTTSNATSAAAPPIPPSRRHSEANNNISLNVAAVTAASRERSKTPPATLPESDLISFSSPTAKETQPSMFDKLIEDLQKLQTSSPQTALVPFGPVAAAPIAPIHPAGGYRGTPPPPLVGTPQHNAAAMYGAAGVGVPAANCMQLVPFTPAPQQQKVPLTSEELQKLYNMPLQQQQQQQQQYYQQTHQHQQYMAAIPSVAGMVYPPPPPPPARPGFVSSVGGFVTPPPSHAANFSQSAPATAAASAAFTPPQFPPTVSHYGFQYGGMPATSSPYYAASNVSATSSAASMPLSKSQSAATAIVSNGSGGGAVGGGGAAGTGVRRHSKAQRTGNDLIDLSQEDDSRVSVLEAFDPLLNVEGEVWKK